MRSECGLRLQSLPLSVCVCAGAICSPRHCNTDTVIKARLWGAASATQLEPQPIREDWQRRWAQGQRWQTWLRDFVRFTGFYFGSGQFAQCQNNIHGQPLLHLTLGNGQDNQPLDACLHSSLHFVEDYCTLSIFTNKRKNGSNCQWKATCTKLKEM